jgi:predicted dinucleotide-binding enzyme
MRIGIIGAGKIGGVLAVRFAAAGHQVMLSNSRGLDTLTGLVAPFRTIVTYRAACRGRARGDRRRGGWLPGDLAVVMPVGA